MLFAINDGKLIIQEKPLDNYNEYQMVSTKQVDEAEMFRIFKKNKNILESKWRLENSNIEFDLDSDLRYKPPISTEPKHRFPFSGSYIIPKMFGYFPFLDCDDINTYTEAKFLLSADDVPYTAYKSSKYEHYWIFCDKQCGIHQAIDFIESYPCDHRYPWIARHKEELCVRAIPKNGYKPNRDDDNLSSEFSDDFKYWNTQFLKYWDNGLIPRYIDMLNTANTI